MPNDTIVKTGADMPRTIAILDSENDTMFIRSVPGAMSSSMDNEEIFSWFCDSLEIRESSSTYVIASDIDIDN